MGYRIVERAESHPAACAVSGFTDGPFVDTGARCPQVNPHIYLNVGVLKGLAETIGMVSGRQLARVVSERDALERQVGDLEAQVRELGGFARAIDVIESQDFRARRKKGPKPRREEQPA